MHRLVGLAAVACVLACPGAVMAQSGTYGSVTLNSGFSDDPRTITVQAVGTRAVDGCVGYFPEQPTFVLNYVLDKDWPLLIYMEASVDTALLISGPNGTQCDDDGWSSEGFGSESGSSSGLDPMLVWEEPAGGLYYIYAGTNQPGVVASAVLSISESAADELIYGD